MVDLSSSFFVNVYQAGYPPHRQNGCFPQNWWILSFAPWGFWNEFWICLFQVGKHSFTMQFLNVSQISVLKDMVQAQVSAGALFSLLPSLETDMPGAVPATAGLVPKNPSLNSPKKDVKRCHKFTTHPGNGGKFTTNQKKWCFSWGSFPDAHPRGKKNTMMGRYPKNGMRSKENIVIS